MLQPTLLHTLALLFSSGLLLGSFGDVVAESRLPSVIFDVDDSMADMVEPGSHTSNIIFLNRCVGGCIINPGNEDSRQNRSSIVSRTVGGPAFISEFAHSQEDWDALVTCVKAVYEPFDITITDQDPGNVSHFEAIVAGVDDEVNYEAAGVAPGGCGITNNAITFSFANQGSLSTLCWTVAQETAHAFGLDHVMECTDPMTYLTECGFDKTFQEIDAPCGTSANRPCKCTGGSTQNSVKLIRDHFGPGTLSPPEVTINRPTNGAVVKSNFPFEVAATDNIKVDAVEFLIDGQVVSELTSPPWVVNAPDGLSGSVQLSARARDNRGTESSMVSLEVTVDDTVIPFGDPCENDDDCEGKLCAQGADGAASCSQRCDLEAEANSCPKDASCIAAGDQGVCWPSKGGSSGLCSAGGSTATWLSGIFLLLMAGTWRRRREILVRRG